MKKKCISAMMAIFVLALWAVPSGAVPMAPYGSEPSLQTLLDELTAGGPGLNASQDFIKNDAYWMATGSGSAKIVFEKAGFKDYNSFGVFNGSGTYEIFSGSNQPGDMQTIDTDAGFLKINGVTTSVSANFFGFYLESPQGMFFSDTMLNVDEIDHMLAYQWTGAEYIENGRLSPTLWEPGEFILAFEDLLGGGDLDFQDFIVVVKSVNPVNPVPEPGTLLLLGSGLLGLAYQRRQRS